MCKQLLIIVVLKKVCSVAVHVTTNNRMFYIWSLNFSITFSQFRFKRTDRTRSKILNRGAIAVSVVLTKRKKKTENDRIESFRHLHHVTPL